MVGETTELRVVFANTCNSQLSPPQRATANATGAQLAPLKALADKVLQRNRPRNRQRNSCATEPAKAAQLAPVANAAELRINSLLAEACRGVAGITPQVFRSLLSPDDIADLLSGVDLPECWRAYARSYAEGIRTRRILIIDQLRTP